MRAIVSAPDGWLQIETAERGADAAQKARKDLAAVAAAYSSIRKARPGAQVIVIGSPTEQRQGPTPSGYIAKTRADNVID